MVYCALSIIVPIYNEEDNISELYARLNPVLQELAGDDWEILFVNDGSTDRSESRIQSICGTDARVKLISFRRNFGQTAAMTAGFEHAAGSVVVPIDGDLQNDPQDIARLVGKLDEGYDVVSGWRKHRKDNRLLRNLPSRVANFLISRLSGVKLHDYGCSLKAYRSEVLDGVRLYGEMHRFIPIYASWQGARVTEIPVQHHPRKHGRSKYGLERVLKVLLDLVVIKFLGNYATKLIYFFGGFGIIQFVAATLAFGWAVYLKLFKAISFISTPLPLLTVMLVLIGFLSILIGLVAELVTRTYYESQGKKPYAIRTTLNLGERARGGKESTEAI
ncbi:MAG: glycosyltransferase family 2 protein [Candidatus Desulforudis sp.]|nr:glycosyltransferase family 2 protein [Desulforudis sp.]